MKFALSFLIVLALVPLALAQEPAATQELTVTSVSVSAQSGEVRVEIHTSAAVSAPSAAFTYLGRLVLDLPGAAFAQSAHRYVINAMGVRDVRVWQQQENPPLTRISIELDKPAPYLLSTVDGGLVLRIGATVPGAALPASSQTRTLHHPSTVEALRPSWAGRAAQDIAGVFHRSQHESDSELPDATPPNSPAPQNHAPPAISAPADSGTNTQSSHPTQTQAAAPTSASSIGPSAVAVASPPNPESSSSSMTPAVAPAAIAAPVPASAPAESASSAATPEPVVGGQPVTSESVGVAQTLVEVPNADLHTVFHVKFVQQDAAYIDGGRSAGLAVGMKLAVKDPAPSGEATTAPDSADAVEAELVVVGVAETSAVTEIHQPKRAVVPGDLAYLSSDDTQALVQQQAVSATRKYPAMISFTEGGDALDEEARAEVPRPPMPSVNHARGRIGFDYMSTTSLDSSHSTSNDAGIVLQADFTRIGGTYWNFNGYWRGRINSISSSTQLQTLQDLINRTYHIGLTYDNPNSHWVAGFGRLYLPWASSLDTIDGGYFGRRVRRGFIIGTFAGSTPDPTSWNYNPNLRLGGAFVNFEGGDFEAFHYSSTSGLGISTLGWQVDRPFVFFENSLSFKRNFSIYQTLQADSPAGNPAVAAPGPGIGRSFITLRWSPIARLQLDANHTYFRDIPTFDPTLVGTGLLDKYLFQGFSGGARVDVGEQISLYTELGRSNRTGDAQSSLNEMYGITFGRIPLLDLRADAHYSRFNSSFGGGSYEAVSLSRDLGERFRLDVLVGNQTFTSTLAGNQSARFLTTTLDSSLGAKFFMEGGFTFYRGQLQSYNQMLFTFGYRFDSKRRRR